MRHHTELVQSLGKRSPTPLIRREGSGRGWIAQAAAAACRLAGVLQTGALAQQGATNSGFLADPPGPACLIASPVDDNQEHLGCPD